MSTSGFDSSDAFADQNSPNFVNPAAPIENAAYSKSLGQPENFNGSMFLECLLTNLRQGVIIIDAKSRVLLWNHSIERMTGVQFDQAVGLKAKPSLFNLATARGEKIEEADCPFAHCLKTGEELRSEFRIVGRSGREVKAELTIIPVHDGSGLAQGAVVLVYDESIQVDLKRQLRDLHQSSSLDTLTQIANRAEFERVLDQYVKTHLSNNIPCSLIVCDIDYFKSINDNYGHHVGDQALTAFAQLLKQFVRAHDVVARYGGEEFVILCADCDDHSAMERAEQIRHKLTQTHHSMLENKCLTASFGVSQLKADDNATDFFVRADTALLKAKELGRNRVVESSTINNETKLLTPDNSNVSGIQWKRIRGRIIHRQEFVTTAPMAVLLQKIGGYIREIDAELVNVDENHTTLKVTQSDPLNNSRKGRFLIDIQLHEVEKKDESETTKTILNVVIRMQKPAMFSKNHEDTYPYALRELRRYLMIHDRASILKVDAAATNSGR